jgi:hypothetical protein
MARRLYDPQLAPEREIIARKEARAAEQVNRITRDGEQYIGTCMAGHSCITSDAGEIEKFAVKHRDCKRKEAA